MSNLNDPTYWTWKWQLFEITMISAFAWGLLDWMWHGPARGVESFLISFVVLAIWRVCLYRFLKRRASKQQP